MIFNTGLTEKEISQLTADDLLKRDILFIPGGIKVPSERIIGAKALFSLAPVEPTPTSTPEAGLTDEEINELAAQLTCGNACIYEAHFGVPGHTMGLQVISTGRFEIIKVTNPNSEELIGHIDALVAITKDSTGKPLVVFYAVQATTVENPNLNLLRAILTQDAVDAGLHEKFETLDDVILEPQPIEFFQTLYHRGKIFSRIVPTDLFGFPPGSWSIDIMRPIFLDPEYSRRIKEFAEKKGSLEDYEEPIILFPA